MTSFKSADGVEHFIFGKDGAKNIANKYNIEILGHIPIDIQISKNCDNGEPFLLNNENDNPNYNLINNIAKKIIKMNI
jgi:ATP-binding protein involved in chromosome partitioning